MRALTITFSLLLLGLLSCQDNNEKRKISENNTTVEIQKKSFNFGKIKQSDSVDHIFKIKNTGDLPLIIKSAKASCGCTVPEWTKTPIKTNQYADIRVKFKPTKTMDGVISKSIVIQANTDSMFLVLYIKGTVEK